MLKRLAVLKLSKPEVLVFGIVLAALEAVQLNISMSAQAHAVVTVVIVVVSGAGVQAVSKTAFLAEIPASLATLISSLLGALLVLIGTFHIGHFWHVVIAVVVVISTALGIGPQPPAVDLAVQS